MYKVLTSTNSHIMYKEEKTLQVLDIKESYLFQSIEFNEEIKYLHFPFVSSGKFLFYIIFSNDYKLIQIRKLNYPPIKILNIGDTKKYLLLDSWGDIYEVNINQLEDNKSTMKKVFGNLTSNFDFNIEADKTNDQVNIKLFDKFRRILNFDLKEKKISSYKLNSCFLTFYNISNDLKTYISKRIGNKNNMTRIDFFKENIYILTFENLFIFKKYPLEEPKVINSVIDFIEDFYLNRKGEIVNIKNSKIIKKIEISKNSIEGELKRSANFF